MTTDFDRILDDVIRMTGVERYRFLCSDANRLPAPNSPADYRRLVLELARQGGPPRVPVDYIPVTPSGGCGGCP